MSDQITRLHLQRLKMATTGKLTRRDLAKWVETETFINGKPYSFKDHEFQERILSDESQITVTRKCSQVGMSETSLRLALGLVSIMQNFSLIYVFPTATFAKLYVKTRLDPIINGSPFLRSAVRSSDSGADSAEVKQLGSGGFLYFRGASSDTAAISVAADAIIYDEYDFADQEIAGQFQSRLTHSPHKIRAYLSTPSVPGGPIDAAFQDSRRHWNFVRCHHCGHRFCPSYLDHVKIPGYDDELRRITKSTLARIRYKEAVLLCPHCGKIPSLQPEHREWVIENPTENHIATGYQVQPFDAPNIIDVPYLVQASTGYGRWADFINFGLGLPAEDADSGITPQDVDAAMIEMDSSPFHTHVIGGDMGLICRLFVAGVTSRDELIIVHTEQIPIGDFRRRYAELARQYRVTSKVLDAQPYVETLLNLQEHDFNLFAAYFVTKKGIAIYDTVSREENAAEGKTALRQISVNKHPALDMILDELRGGRIKIRRTKDAKDIKDQLTASKRSKKVTEDGQLSIWNKPSHGDDHFHYALLYTWLAAQIRGAASRGYGQAPMVGTFKLRPPKSEQARSGTGMG
ncbi:Bacteriophage tail assembly protein [Variovorax sp. PBS-H4]|uniref:phage terminase large subunit family protein n=1 Tax=Variovorax sp. PBS-H4 TaxID=434008 RepID=UPI0013198113|nr:phage terminase large subunit family protein [Variovorax sp. PBS-H4]VTU32222.1 Bacteriophage tail assembly protein [Variovorax sp. PBS-H4]